METLVAADTRWIDLSLIDLPKNARPHRPEDLESLAEDMAKEGQLQEIVVMPSPYPLPEGRGLTAVGLPPQGEGPARRLAGDEGNHFVVVAGVGRTLAARKLKWEKIRCFVKDSLSEFDRLHITFSENEEREDVSPVYQAQLLQRMKESGNFKDQKEMANKIGKSEAVLSQYLSLLGLDASVRQKFDASNLTLRQGLELKRLPNADLQLQMAEECAKDGLSGKALKAAVDKKVISTPSPQRGGGEGEGGRVPRATITFTPAGPDIKFSGQAPQGVSLEGLLDQFREKLYAWMGVGEPKENPAVEAVLATDAPTSSDSSPRIPKTPEEQTELEALAAQSPHAVYQWIFGPESFLAQRMATTTWQSMGITDPKEGLKQILEGVKVVEASKAGRKKRE